MDGGYLWGLPKKSIQLRDGGYLWGLPKIHNNYVMGATYGGYLITQYYYVIGGYLISYYNYVMGAT